MGLGLKRHDLQQLAELKCADAQLLLQNRRFTSSYYLAGYAIELGLKACISKQFVAEVIPDKSFVQSVHTHNFKALVGLAGLSAEFKNKEDIDLSFAANFAIVAQWGPEVRYEVTDAMSAQVMITAITDPASGVLPWIKLYW